MLINIISFKLIKKWDQFKQTVMNKAKSTFGSKEKEWFDKNQEEICIALEEKNQTFTDW